MVRNSAGSVVEFDSLTPDEQAEWRARSNDQIKDALARQSSSALKPIVSSVSPEEQRARSRGGLDRPIESATWANSIPQRPDPMSKPIPMQRLEDMPEQQRALIRELM